MTGSEHSAPILVCDEAGAASDLADQLRSNGYRVIIASDGYEALELLRDEKPCAVVLEVMLRDGLNGFGLLNVIEIEHPALVAHTFIVTVMSEQAALRFAPSFGARIFRKPVDSRKLLAAIEETLGGRSRRSDVSTRLALVVDDDLPTRELLTGYLEERSFRTTEATDGREALAAIEEERPAVILLDLLMPGIDGASILEHFSQTEPRLLRRTIVLTGMPDKYLQTLPRQPVRGVLGKPVDLEVLGDLLARDDH